MNPTLELACSLIELASVTPNDAGCQRLLADRLESRGFETEWFQFGGVNYTITGYTFTALVQGFDKNIPSSSANLSSDMRETIRNSRSGSRIYFNDITAVGPDGSTRNLPTVAIKIR